MRISMFTNTFLPHIGGVARSVSAFAEDLRAMGHQVLVVAPTFEGQPRNEDADQVLRVTAIQRFNGSDFSVHIPLPGVIDDRINDFQPEIIHSHHPFLLGDAALRAARRRDLPVVFTHHTLYERYTHYVPFDSAVMKRFVIHLAVAYANLCHRVIAPSTSIKALLEGRGVTAPVEVLPSGVDLDFFQAGRPEVFRRRMGIPAGQRIIGHVGRLAREKNLAFLAGAVSRFLAEREGFVFVVAGTGDSRDEIIRICEARGVGHRLILPGVLRGQELADCYRAMDLFVFASHSETQGLVLAEAMAAGVPVIALAASGVGDVVEDGKNGRILPAGSPEEAFASAMAAAFDSGAVRLWQPAALSAARRFARPRCAARLAALYETTLSGATSHRHETDLLDTVRRSLAAEWELLQEKAAAVRQSLQDAPGPGPAQYRL
ncbi:MAG: glycosyltransferase [Thermodesulfobacteriota bacterium]